jgi:FkbM family methyltransferase
MPPDAGRRAAYRLFVAESQGRHGKTLRKVRIALTPRQCLLKTVLANGAIVYGRNRAGYGGRGVFIEGDALEPELEHLEEFLGDEGVFVDVGANTGVYSLKAACHYQSRGLVIAVEPFVDVLATLARSVEANRLSNIRLRNVCLGEGTTTRTLWMNRSMPNSFSLAHRAGEAQGLSVLTVALDDLFAWEGLDRLDYLKVDAEGAEEEIIAGGRATIERYRPIVQLETTIRKVHVALPRYATFRASGSSNVVLIPEEHDRTTLPSRLGWARIG